MVDTLTERTLRWAWQRNINNGNFRRLDRIPLAGALNDGAWSRDAIGAALVLLSLWRVQLGRMPNVRLELGMLEHAVAELTKIQLNNNSGQSRRHTSY